MNTGRLGADNALLQGLRNGTPSLPGSVAVQGSGSGHVDYSTYQLEALRRAADKPEIIPSAGVTDDMPPAGAGSEARLRWAAEQLEALFIHELLKSMRRTVMKTGMLDGMGTKMFEEMLDEERSKEMAGAGGLGLARLIYEQMAPHVPRTQEEVSVQRNEGEGRTKRSAEETKSGEVT